jgi:hypothetical protein
MRVLPGSNRDWIERQLAHVERNEVRRAYNAAEWMPPRRRMMQWWADYLSAAHQDQCLPRIKTNVYCKPVLRLESTRNVHLSNISTFI